MAPLWQNYNTALTGTVRWRIYDNVNNTGELASVNLLIQTEQNDESFNGIWMLVASWENVGYLLDDIFVSLYALLVLYSHSSMIFSRLLIRSKPYWLQMVSSPTLSSHINVTALGYQAQLELDTMLHHPPTTIIHLLLQILMLIH